MSYLHFCYHTQVISSDRILYEDENLLTVNKRSGELVVRGSGNVQKLPLFDFLRKDYPGLRVVHRLDFETSGVVLFARTKETYALIQSSKCKVHNLGWKKIYRTIVIGRLEQKYGVISKKLPARGVGMVEAVTKYRVLKIFKDVSYVEAEIETGRQHQIRRHFALIGNPLVLDDVYGDGKFNRKFAKRFGYRKFFLHALRLELVHPMTGKKLVIEASLPGAFERLLQEAR